MSIEAYGEHPLQTVKWFQKSSDAERNLVLIHGGAWRDTNNTYDDYKELVSFISPLEKTNIVGINYRLSPEIKHPTHIEDVVTALNKVVADSGVARMSVVGHSVGATLMLQMLNYKEICRLAHGLLPQNFADLASIDIQAMFFVDGIYDMVDLIEEYGGPYTEFVENAFTSDDQYRNGSQVTWSSDADFQTSPGDIVVIQSTEDELLSLRQTKKFLSFLQSRGLKYTYVEEKWGLHEEVYRRKELADLILNAIN